MIAYRTALTPDQLIRLLGYVPETDPLRPILMKAQAVEVVSPPVDARQVKSREWRVD